MPIIEKTVECEIPNSFRVQQVRGMFDLTPEEKSKQAFRVEIPGMDEEWKIGLIVGPSGSGKTSISGAAFPGAVYKVNPQHWPNGAIVDGFGEKGIREITGALTAVGFGSPPAWLRSYDTLSNGEKFRCDLARALLTDQPIVAFDILEWLEPDWVVDMATQTLARGSLCRPKIEIKISRCDRRWWSLFAKHHYLSEKIPNPCACYLATWGGEPVAFAAISGTLGYAGYWRVSRIVVLPDYQGIGIGSRMRDLLASYYTGSGGVDRFGILTSHPAMIASCKKSALWKCRAFLKNGCSMSSMLKSEGYKNSAGRAVVSFEYVGPKLNCGLPEAVPLRAGVDTPASRRGISMRKRAANRAERKISGKRKF